MSEIIDGVFFCCLRNLQAPVEWQEVRIDAQFAGHESHADTHSTDCHSGSFHRTSKMLRDHEEALDTLELHEWIRPLLRLHLLGFATMKVLSKDWIRPFVMYYTAVTCDTAGLHRGRDSAVV